MKEDVRMKMRVKICAEMKNFEDLSVENSYEEEEQSAEVADEEESLAGSHEDFEGDQEEEEVNESEEEEEEEKTYSKEDHPTMMFLTLTEFRDASILTDLSLHTADGRSLRVHSIVLAAVSSLIWRHLSRRNDEIGCRGDEVNDEDYEWSMVLGPEVDRVGLQAVVDFAYAGHTDLLNKQNLEQIQAAALALGAGRLLDLCVKEEQPSKKPAENETDGSLSAAQQLVMNLELIELLWEEGVGCDVTLEARGGSLQVHRVMLAANSDYFRGMFTLDMKESRQPRVKLPYLLETELELIIGSSYTGELCPETCLDVISFAQAYQITDLLEIADDYVLRQFQKLVVFKAVVTWILAQPRKRLRLAKELMKTVHFPLMTFKEFKEVRYQNMWSDHNLTELYEAIF
ncbi:hypothetical protein OJAV_G00179580 [Oryzias javanicus]|uniref:BTB domain-containing protein n=1 Tax=Oryzias javanicus TaxID=123683 RepID=A0A437CBW1_ORYJA|nr:hypothetical protein OJAV_G00179580 [Oryzias javanicus]